MAIRISQLPTIDVFAVDDLFPVRDTSSSITKSATGQKVLDAVQLNLFVDNIFRVVGSVDPTKKIAFEADGLTTATTRTLTAQDRDITIGIVLATPQATTSGTSIDFTAIPSGVRRITLMFDGVSTSGISNLLVQLGDSGGVENTGYVAGGWTQGGVFTDFTAGFGIVGGAAANIGSGAITLTLLNSSTNMWTCNGQVRLSTTTAAELAGAKATSAVLDRIRLTTVNGTDTFDAGNLNIAYEF